MVRLDRELGRGAVVPALAVGISISFHARAPAEHRHACASFLLALGVHPRMVMEMLGRSQIGLTMNPYSHVIRSLQREAAERLDSLLREGDTAIKHA